jgi:hypothetical protein
MATSCGLLELVGLGRLLGLLELVGVGRLLGLLELVGLGRLLGLLELVGLLELGELSLVGTMALWVGWRPGVCPRAGRFVLPGVVDEEADMLGDGVLPGVVDEEDDMLGDGLPAEEAGDWLGM